MKKALSPCIQESEFYTFQKELLTNKIILAIVNKVNQKTDTMLFQYNGNGRYTRVTGASPRATATTENQTEGDYIVAACFRISEYRDEVFQ